MGIYYKWMEYKRDLHKFIKELEEDRIENDLINHNKYDTLYEIYHNIDESLNR